MLNEAIAYQVDGKFCRRFKKDEKFGIHVEIWKYDIM